MPVPIPLSEELEAPATTSPSRLNVVLVLLSLSVLINYIDRSNLSIAAPLIKDELHLSATQLGTLLSAFFWVYCCLQIPAGWLVDRFDVKWVFAAGFLIWSAATAVTSALHGFIALLLIRLLLGVGESIAFPSYSKIIRGHFRATQRGFANSVLVAGLALGPALGMMVGGTAVGRFGWRPFFLILGAIGLLWLVPWVSFMPARERVSGAQAERFSSAFLAILHERSAWGMCVCHFSMNYGLYFLVTWLPFYLVRGRHLSMNQMAGAGGLIFFVAAVVALVTGKLADRWVASGSSPTLVFKGLCTLSCIGLGACLIASVVARDSVFLVLLVLGGAFNGLSFGNIWAATQILAGPKMVGRWVGLQNFVGNFSGPIAPALTGFLLDRTGRFYWAFLITAAILWVGALSWIFLVGPLVPVEWEKRRSVLPLVATPAE